MPKMPRSRTAALTAGLAVAAAGRGGRLGAIAVSALCLAVTVSAGCGDSATAAAGQRASASQTRLPNKNGTFKFAVLGDFGSGDRRQYELAAQMAAVRARFPFKTVLLTGDNLYGSERPQDFKRKFEDPYKPLLDAGVKFYASLGNHDSREQRYYKLFNMEGNLYYTFNPASDVRFFIFESTYPEPEQIRWLEKELAGSTSKWKIVVFHHPLYSSGKRHGSDRRLREALEPLLLKHNVSVVFNGHDHFYERVKPQKGITYFVVGAGGQLRSGNIDRSSGLTAGGFDTDLSFLAAEIDGDHMYFNGISRSGQVVDSGVVTRRTPLEP